MCRGASNTPAICPGRLHRGRVRFGEPFRVRRPNSHADRVRLVVPESQSGSTRTVDLSPDGLIISWHGRKRTGKWEGTRGHFQL